MVGTLVKGCTCATSWCDLDLTFDLAALTLTCISETVRCRKLILGRDIGLGCRCASSWSDLDFFFDLVTVTMSFKILSGLFLLFHKV